MLRIQNLHATIQDTPILHGVSLQIMPGEVHAIMGPNGSGKSTLSNVIAGHPAYTVTAGSITYNDVDVLELEADKRALLGIFLAFQYPKEIAGVSLRNFLFAAYSAHMQARFQGSQIVSPIKFKKLLIETMESLKMDPQFADRMLNKGFSGGEKKKAEILQMKLLQPTLALLDETDSGLDIDALQIVANHVSNARGPNFSALIVTHYARLLEFITPDYVHIMIKGKIVKSGTASLAHELEKNGYQEYTEKM